MSDNGINLFFTVLRGIWGGIEDNISEKMWITTFLVEIKKIVGLT